MVRMKVVISRFFEIIILVGSLLAYNEHESHVSHLHRPIPDLRLMQYQTATPLGPSS